MDLLHTASTVGPRSTSPTDLRKRPRPCLADKAAPRAQLQVVKVDSVVAAMVAAAKMVADMETVVGWAVEGVLEAWVMEILAVAALGVVALVAVARAVAAMEMDMLEAGASGELGQAAVGSGVETQVVVEVAVAARVLDETGLEAKWAATLVAAEWEMAETAVGKAALWWALDAKVEHASRARRGSWSPTREKFVGLPRGVIERRTASDERH